MNMKMSKTCLVGNFFPHSLTVSQEVIVTGTKSVWLHCYNIISSDVPLSLRNSLFKNIHHTCWCNLSFYFSVKTRGKLSHQSGLE